ncbi:nucleic acid-binding protein, partial [Suhomyces tanzawaensis NRRL Y-17324]
NPTALNLRVGKIILCEKHADADKLYVSQIQVKDEQELVQVCSGLVNHIPIEQMVDRRVVVLTNLKPSKMRGVKSEAMLLASEIDGQVDLIEPPQKAVLGGRLQFETFLSEVEPSRLKPNVWEDIQKHLRTTSLGEAAYVKDGKEYILKYGPGASTSLLKNAPIR